MEVLEISFENWYTFLLRINLPVIVFFIVGAICFMKFISFIIPRLHKKSIYVDEVNLGIGSNTVKLSYCTKDKEIAYKLWVELSTRKIGIPYDEENDVISEVYDSWYEFFKISRDLLKELPVSRLPYSNELVDLVDKVMNHGLRPHLTVWQAKYRKWYECESVNNKNISPQDLQKMYPQYDELIVDLKKTNEKMIHYKDLMKKIAFSENE